MWDGGGSVAGPDPGRLLAPNPQGQPAQTSCVWGNLRSSRSARLLPPDGWRHGPQAFRQTRMPCIATSGFTARLVWTPPAGVDMSSKRPLLSFFLWYIFKPASITLNCQISATMFGIPSGTGASLTILGLVVKPLFPRSIARDPQV